MKFLAYQDFLKIKNIYFLLNEALKKNRHLLVTYHRTPSIEGVENILKSGFSPDSFGTHGGSAYGGAVYMTHELSSTLGEFSKRIYSKDRVGENSYIIQSLTNINKFFIFDYEEYVNFYGKKNTNWLLDQYDILKLKGKDKNRDLYYSLKKIQEDIKGKESSSILAPFIINIIKNFGIQKWRAFVKGIIYDSVRDGKVVLAYDTRTVTPYKYSEDEGKTFKKISKEQLKGIYKSQNKIRQNWRYERYDSKIDPNKPKSKKELLLLLKNVKDNANLNYMDVSLVTDMSQLFLNSTFNGDISEWNVKNVTNMELMFGGSSFDGDISKWEIDNVKNMRAMFIKSEFTGKNGDISSWDISNCLNFENMFADSNFTGELSNWKINKEASTLNMFKNLKNKKAIPSWYKTKKYTPKDDYELSVTIRNIISSSNDEIVDLNNIDVSNITDLSYISQSFGNKKVDISKWETRKVKNMSSAFEDYPHDVDISNWEVGNVVTMRDCFSNSKMNPDIREWDTSNVENMRNMFYNNKAFDWDISNWNVNKVKNFENMFKDSNFSYADKLEKWKVDYFSQFAYGMFANSKSTKFPSWYIN